MAVRPFTIAANQHAGSGAPCVPASATVGRKNVRSGIFVAGLLLAILSPTARAAVITYAGLHENVESHADDPAVGWRNAASPAKPLDLDGDNIYGSDGYTLFGRPYEALPSYVTAIQPLQTALGPLALDYAMIDNPDDPSGPDIKAGTLFLNGVIGEFAFASFVVNGNAPSLFRLGILVDNGDSPNPPPFIRVAGALGDSGQFQGNTLPDRNPDWYFVDIQGAQAGDEFTVYFGNTDTGNLLLGGLTFDNDDVPPDGVPEPSSAMLLGIGALMVQRLVRQRRQDVTA